MRAIFYFADGREAFRLENPYALESGEYVVVEA